MSDTSAIIKKVVEMRQFAAEQMAKAVRNIMGQSETEFADSLAGHFKNHADIYDSGWYSPPPNGIAVLFAPEDNPKRLLFDNLRKEEYWPASDHCFGQNSLGIIYCSPVEQESGAIGDFGLTVYNGQDQKIWEHIKKSLAVIKTVAEAAEVGMQFKDLHTYAQALFKENGLTNQRTLAKTDPSGTGIGHTIPFTTKSTSDTNLSIITSRNFEEVKKLISESRIFINPIETFTVKENCAFTVEARLESLDDSNMPNTFFHLLVTFEKGKKTIYSNFNFIFEITGMEKFIKTKY